MKKSISLLCVLLSAGLQANIQPLPLQFEPDPFFETDFQVFPISSEMQLGKIQHLVLPAEPGVYLTVGSERSFRGASMMPNVTYLIQIDVAPDIIRYNLINKELLKAPTLHEYKRLRWEASFLDWKQFIAKSNEQKIKVKLNQDDYTWWQQEVRDIEGMEYPIPEQLNRFKSAPFCPNDDISALEKKIDLGQILDFKTGNYLFSETLYQRLHQLAVNNRILTSQINLMDEGQTQKLIHYLKENNLHVSVLDLDNLYFESYLGQDRYQALVKSFLPLGNDQSRLIVMDNYKDFACGQYQLYLGFTFERIKQLNKDFGMQNFIHQLPKETHDLIDGRLYEVDEPLPDFSGSASVKAS